jgi:hypothetical protein
MSEPSGRALAGTGIIVVLIAIWALLVASLAATVGQWPVLLQAMFYLVTGLVWIIPLRRLVGWIVTGRFTRG